MMHDRQHDQRRTRPSLEQKDGRKGVRDPRNQDSEQQPPLTLFLPKNTGPGI